MHFTWLYAVNLVLAGIHLPTCLEAYDELGSISLSPYWDLTFGVGEHLEMDCGVFVNGTSDGLSVSWQHPNQRLVSNLGPGNRVYTSDTSSLGGSRDNQAYFVLTLHILNLTLEDSGEYICIADVLSRPDLQATRKSINVAVLDSGEVCNFEGTLCEWQINASNDAVITWQHHDGKHLMRTGGARHDHTYGSSKSQGMFLDVEATPERPGGEFVSNLTSPIYASHVNSSSCLHFWYARHGKAVDAVRLALEPTGSGGGEAALTYFLDKLPETGGEWREHSVEILSQANPYQIILQAYFCSKDERDCDTGYVAIDDVHMHHVPCDNVTENTPETVLQMRLIGELPNGRAGRVEVLHQGQWGTICAVDLDIATAKVICRNMGYSVDFAHQLPANYFQPAPDNYPIWLTNVHCVGHEPDLGSCLAAGETWGQNYCPHSLDLGVTCHNFTGLVLPTSTELPPPSTTTRAPPIVPSTSTTEKTSVLPSEVTSSAKSSPSSYVISTTDTNPEVKSSFMTSVTSTLPTYSTNNTNELTDASASRNKKRNAGAAVVLSLLAIIAVVLIGTFAYRKKGHARVRKNSYIVFDNPKYQRDNLPSNDLIMDSSPLSVNGPILA